MWLCVILRVAFGCHTYFTILILSFYRGFRVTSTRASTTPCPAPTTATPSCLESVWMITWPTPVWDARWCVRAVGWSSLESPWRSVCRRDNSWRFQGHSVDSIFETKPVEMKHWRIRGGGRRGWVMDLPPPPSTVFIFMQFLAKVVQNQGWCPLPRLGNPGSTTAKLNVSLPSIILCSFNLSSWFIKCQVLIFSDLICRFTRVTVRSRLCGARTSVARDSRDATSTTTCATSVTNERSPVNTATKSSSTRRYRWTLTHVSPN